MGRIFGNIPGYSERGRTKIIPSRWPIEVSLGGPKDYTADSRAFEPLAKIGDGFDESLAKRDGRLPAQIFSLQKRECRVGHCLGSSEGGVRSSMAALQADNLLHQRCQFEHGELARVADVSVARGNHFPHTPLNEGILGSSRRSNRTTWFANRLHRSSAVVPRVPAPRSC